MVYSAFCNACVIRESIIFRCIVSLLDIALFYTLPSFKKILNLQNRCFPQNITKDKKLNCNNLLFWTVVEYYLKWRICWVIKSLEQILFCGTAIAESIAM